jgi:5-methylcytosine-specific restriction endonuclease McrA
MADMPAIADWVLPLVWTNKNRLADIRYREVSGAPVTLAKPDRNPKRKATPTQKADLIALYGYNCAFCGIPLITAEVRKALTAAYPEAARWVDRKDPLCHAALLCMGLEYDHVLPHSRGGDSSLSNLVVTCAGCNYGRMAETLEEVGVLDPRLKPATKTDWDGLQRLLVSVSAEADGALSSPVVQAVDGVGKTGPLRMSWERKYWDIVDNLYWAPSYLGLEGIPQKDWVTDGEMVCVPRSLVNSRGGPIYARKRTDVECAEWMRGQEDVLNHIFNITFAIAPDELLETLFCRPLGIRDRGPFQSAGREIAERYGWSRNENVTQQDGLFIGERTAIGVELKLESRSSLNQLAKYVALLVLEERVGGPRENLGLLFLLPEGALESHWRTFGITGAKVDASMFDAMQASGLKGKIKELFENDPDHVKSVLSRMKLAAESWSSFRTEILAVIAALNPATAGDQTLQRLMAGFLAQLEGHRGTGLTAT